MNLKHSNIRLLKNPILKPIATPQKNQNPLNSRVTEEQLQRNQTKRSQHHFIKDASIDPRDVKLNISSSELDNLFTNDFSDNEVSILRRWLVAVYENICSDAFNKLNNGQLTESQVKAYAAKNIIFNINTIFQKIGDQVFQQTRRKIMSFINKESQQIFKEIIIKYPQASVQSTYRKIKHKISKIDNRLDQTYDLIRYCDPKITFKDDEKQDNISQIMTFINYLINLPSSDIPGEVSQFTMFQGFQVILETLVYFDAESNNFQTVLNQYLQKNQKFSIDSFRTFFQDYQSENNQKNCKLKMSQKIHPSTVAFTKQEIQQGDFSILDAPILRIMDKWVEQLEQKLKNPTSVFSDASFKFKLHDGEQSYLNAENLLYLTLKCQQNWEKVKSYQNKIYESLISMQQTLFQQKYEGKYINDIDTNIGILAARTQSCIGQYMLQYLNKIISTLLLIPKQVVVDQRFQTKSPIMGKLDLITFKVGDIMRARCEASQQAIISIFKSMQALSQKLPNVFKLIRVKDRLEKKDNDILINFFFMNKVQCQIQFSVISGTTQHIKQQHLNSFNHFLYELSRAKFGPVAECACIATQYDPLSKSFALRKKIMPEATIKRFPRFDIQFLSLPQQKKINLLNQSLQIKKEKLNVFPYFCSVCKMYIKNNDPLSFSQKINTLQYKQCTQCHVKRILHEKSEPEFVYKIFQQKYKQQNQLNCMKNHITLLNGKFEQFKEILTQSNDNSDNSELGHQSGFAKKKGKQSQLFYFKISVKLNFNKPSKFLFIRFQQGKFEIFAELQFKLNPNFSDEQQQNLIQIDDQQIKKIFNKYLIFILAKNKHSYSFNILDSLNGQKINQYQIQDKYQLMVDTIKCYQCKVQKMKLAQYKGNYKKMAQKLENLKQLKQVIEKQKQSYQGFSKQFTDQFDTIPICKFLKVLKLKGNKIKDLSFVKKLPNLERIQIQENEVTNFPDFSANKNLKYIIGKQNHIQSLLPLKDLRQLLVLQMSNTCFQNFKGLQNCNKLKRLIVEFTNTLQTLDGLQMCEQLQIVEIYNAKKAQNLEKLKDCIKIKNLKLTNFSKLYSIKDTKKMSQLACLHILNAPLSSLQGIQGCFNLKEIKIINNSNQSRSKINSIQPISKLLKLEILYILYSQLESIEVPEKLILKQINFSDNKIKSLQGIQMFPELEQLTISKNKVSSLTPISKLYKLRTVQASYNQIQSLVQLDPVKALQEFYLYYNPLKSLQGIEKQTSLRYLGIPSQLKSFQQLRNLIKLQTINSNAKQKFLGSAKKGN